MSNKENLIRDIKTVMEAIRLDWMEIDQNFINPEQVSELKLHIQYCLEELKKLYERLDELG